MLPSVASIPEKERLSDALHRMLLMANGRPLAIREMVDILHGRGMLMIIILLCLPFLSPVTIPGISIPFGLAIALSGLRLAFGQKPWLPAFVLDRRIPYPRLEKIVGFGCRMYEKIERIIRPRLSFFLEGRAATLSIGLTIAVAGILLSLPIPPPFPLTNTIPGFAIIFLSLGIMERDGLLILLGYVFTTIAIIYLSFIGLLGTAGVAQVLKLINGG